MDDIKFTLEDENISVDGDDIVLSDDEIKLSKQKPKKKTAFKAKPRFQPRPSHVPQKPQVFHQPQTMSQPQLPAFHDKTFETFSNPQKRMQQTEDDIPSNNGDSNTEASEVESAGYGDDFPHDEVHEDTGPHPSPGFNTIEDEKQDLLYRFHRLESKGVKLPKKYNMYSDIREMRSDFDRIKRDHEVNASIKFSRRMLMAVVSASEFLNKRYDPFGLELNGWSETVMENTGDGDFDNIFERLHDKYAGKVNTPPELELMLSLGGSAIMFHMTSTMFKTIPNLGAMAQNNPEMQQAMSNLAQNIMKQQTQSNTPSDINQHNSQNGRRKMKGPSMDLSGIGNMMPPPMPSSSFMPQQPTHQPEIAESVISEDDAMSSVSGLSIKDVSVTVGGTRRGRKPKISATKENTIDLS